MHDQDPQQMLGQAERLVEKAMHAGADEAEVYWTRSVGLEIVIENSAIQGGGRARTEGAGLRVIKDGRLGFAYLTDAADAEKTIQRALRLSRMSPQKPMSFPSPTALPSIEDQWDGNTATLDVAGSLSLAQDMLNEASQHPDVQLAGGGVDTGWHLEAIANNHGVGVAHRSTATSIGLNLVTSSGDAAMNLWDDEVAHIGAPDGPAIVNRCVDDLLSLRNPTPSKSGEVDVIFRPSAASELVGNLVGSAVDGDDALRGKTVWSDKLDQAVAAPDLQIVDDPLRAGAIGATPFDGDGAATRATPIIHDGILRTFLFDTRDAAEHDCASTHHAQRNSFKSPPGVGAHHLIIEGSDPRPDDRIISDVDDGYLVESVLGAHTANATTGDFSITAPNVWRIEGGDVVGAAGEIAIAGNLPNLLMRVDGIGATPRKMDGAWVPMLRFRDVHVSA